VSAPQPYEIVPYDDRPVAETHPDRLWLAARIAGLQIERPERMRVLELGCAHAVNLVPFAFHLPQARFLGIDLSPTQIERARARVAPLGLQNLELRCADVMDFATDETFDVIIAHGLFSWVPDVVRDKVLALCRHALAPDGVAYISYNAMPGWGVRGGIRRALQEIVGDEPDPEKQVARARKGLGRLAAIDPLRGTAEGALLEQEIAALHDKSDAYLLHEYLTPHGRAYWSREFMTLADAAGLAYVGDVAPTGVAEHARVLEAMRELVGGDRIAAEQVADVITFREFRATLLCRADARRSPPDPHALVESLHLAAPPREEPAPDAIVAWLRERWPADVPFAELPRDATASSVWAHHLAGHVQLRPRALPTASTPGERPAVADLTCFEASHAGFVVTPLHEYCPLDAFHAALIRHLDGTRDRAALVEILIDDIAAGHLALASRATAAQLRQALPAMVNTALAGLTAAGLLLR
jgi:SAM-dependent methyltransferase